MKVAMLLALLCLVGCGSTASNWRLVDIGRQVDLWSGSQHTKLLHPIRVGKVAGDHFSGAAMLENDQQGFLLEWRVVMDPQAGCTEQHWQDCTFVLAANLQRVMRSQRVWSILRAVPDDQLHAWQGHESALIGLIGAPLRQWLLDQGFDRPGDLAQSACLLYQVRGQFIGVQEVNDWDERCERMAHIDARRFVYAGRFY